MPYPIPPVDIEPNLFESVNPITGLLNGGPAAPANMTGISSDTAYAIDGRNSGTGGGARLRDNAGGALRVVSGHVEIDGGLQMGGNLTITGGSLRLDNNQSVQIRDSGGTYRMVAVVNGSNQARFGSATLAAHIDGSAATINANTTIDGTLTAGAISGTTGAFSGAVSVASLAATGAVTAATATITGAGAGNDQALFLKHNTGAGQFSLGATNAADPSLIAKDHAGDEVIRLNPTGSTYALDVNTPSPRSTNAARFTGDVLITTNLGVAAINATAGISGTTGTFSGAISGTSGTFSGGISAGALSVFNAAVSITSGSLSVVGNVGFNNKTPAAAPDYTVTNLIVNRSIDPSVITEAQDKYVLATLIQDLINIGILS